MRGNDSCYSVQPIGHVKSPFKTKFGLPRQSGIITSENAMILMEPRYSSREAFRALEKFSHIWLTFIFHQSLAGGWKNTVRPPRLGGNQKVGVFASRSPYRPNHIGQSVVELHDVFVGTQTELHISCPDLVDNTPIIDIKPYVHYSDSIPNANSGFAKLEPESKLSVIFLDVAETQLNSFLATLPRLRNLIIETITLDPRPAYKRDNDKKVYAIRLYDLDVHFRVDRNQATVTQINALSN